MHRIALFKVTDSEASSGFEYDQELVSITESFEDISDEDFNLLDKALSRQGYYNTPRYVMVEQHTINKVKEDLSSIIKQIRAEEEKYKKYQEKFNKQTEEIKKKIIMMRSTK
jgi:hypothetical protein